MSLPAIPDQHPIAPMSAGAVDQLEREFLQHEQADCPVIHRFFPGIYIREVMVPAGVFAIGHRQKTAHLNVFLKGRVTVVNEDGSHTELVAPMTFLGQPGRKVGYVSEDMVWQNIYATEETDIDKLESMFLDKSEGWQQAQIERLALPFDRAQDRLDYQSVLDEFGFTEQQARTMSEDESDQIAFPHGSYKVKLADSQIQGRGLFATGSIAAGEWIAPARIGGMRTPAGRFTNHAREPNAVMQWNAQGDIDLIALRNICGCTGGQDGEEITIDYRQALGLQITPLKG